MLQTWFDRYQRPRSRRQVVGVLLAFDDRKLAAVGTFRGSIALILRRAAQDISGSEL